MHCYLVSIKRHQNGTASASATMGGGARISIAQLCHELALLGQESNDQWYLI